METKGYQNFEQLELWKKARELKNEIYLEVKAFPPEEKYRLVDQLTRRTRSDKAQVVERHGRLFISFSLSLLVK